MLLSTRRNSSIKVTHRLQPGVQEPKTTEGDVRYSNAHTATWKVSSGPGQCHRSLSAQGCRGFVRGPQRQKAGPGRSGMMEEGPHSPFSRVCRFARTRRKVCRGETRADTCQRPRPAAAGCQQPPPPRKQGPVPPPRASSGRRTGPGPAPPPRPNSSTHLFPAPAAGPPPAALHSRGRPAGRRGGGPGAAPPAWPGMRADTARPGRRRRSAPSGRRHVGPGHVTRRRAGESSPGKRQGEERKFPWQPTGGSKVRRAPANQSSAAVGN